MDLHHEQRRLLRVTIRLSATEHTRLLTASDRAGLTLSGYLRYVLTAERPPRAARRPVVERAVLARLLGELGQTGEFLRRVARALQSAPHTSVFMVERDLARALKQLTAVQAALMGALGRKAGRA
jgi:hypothetical protein